MNAWPPRSSPQGASSLTSFSFVAASPPALVTTIVHSSLLGPWEVEFAHTPGLPYAIFGSLINGTTFPILGIDFLVNSFQLVGGNLNSAGYASFEALAGPISGQFIYTQGVTLDLGTFTLAASPVGQTLIL